MIVPAARALETISAGIIAPGYLLLGRELYWRDRIWTALRHILGFEDTATGLQEVDLRQSSLDALLAKAAERNLWCSRQLLLVRNAHAISGAKQLENLEQYFGDPNPDSVLVFEMVDVDLESDDWRERDKVKSRQEHWGSLCEVILLAAPSRKEALELVRREAEKRGCRIAESTAESLIAFAERDFGRIVRELDKLCLFRSSGSEITAEDVELLAGNRGASHGLSLAEAIGSGNPSTVLEAFEDRVPKGAYLPLTLSELTRYLRQLLLLQGVTGRDAREASKLLWSARLPAAQGLLPELLRQARAFSPRHLVDCLQSTLQAEVALRSSPADDRLIVERLMLDISRPLRSGRRP